MAQNVYSQKISFDNKISYKLSDLKSQFQIHTVEVYNYEIRTFEKYNAFSFKEILNKTYGKDNWQESFAIKALTKDSYSPIIETYKFKKRKPYLAFEKSDKSSFTTIQDYKDEVINLTPFYLIWKEDYKKDAAKRRNHWVYRLTNFYLLKSEPNALIPKESAPQGVKWGYKNYIKQCIGCHSILTIGGDSGGEMFKDIKISNRSDTYLHKFISNPRRLNKKSIMPPFPRKIDIRKERIINIVKYLRHMDKTKP